jgi:DNA-binding MarR family transcriptional regulator/GNAT superfamily N-acetyltransferase
MHTSHVDQVRRFNRIVTQRVGALEDGYLSRGRPLGQARVLWEIGDEGCSVRELRGRLGLDSGHLSRLLRALERDGLVRLETDPHDRRVRVARLTGPGLAERAELERRSDDLATATLARLSDRQRVRLTDAMAVVERLLTASLVEVAVVDPRDPRARGCVSRYIAELDERGCVSRYIAELDERFGGFDPSRSIPADDAELTPPAGLLLLATLHGNPVGCGALKLHAGAPAEIKRMWVSPDARGLGLGRRLLRELEARAWAHGCRAVRLETNHTLIEALELYRSSGFREIDAFNDEPYAHHWFEKSAPVEPPPP